MASSSSSSPSSWPTLDAFMLDLTGRLREGGSTSLTQFETSINGDCYDWLDDYLDNIEAQGRRAPIAELMKTPSRTATAKKTRATATANKARAEQIRQFNLAHSPLTKTPAGRIPFSPLRLQDANSVAQSPSRPSRPPLKGISLVLTPMKEEAPKPAPKKRGRPKKNADVDKENAQPEDAPSKSTRSASAKATPASTATKSTKTRKGKAKKEAKVAEPEPEPEPVAEPEAAAQPEPAPEVEAESEPIPVVEEPPTLAAAMAAAEEEALAESIVVEDSFETINLEPSTEAVADEGAEAMEVDEPTPVTQHVVHVSPAKEATPPKSPSPELTKSPSPVKVVSPVKRDSPAKETSPPRPSVPTRQVRSSWLSQALGTSTVPVGHRLSTQLDPLRKSQMASSQSKRKSDADEDEIATSDKRPDKVARFDSTTATDAASGLPMSPKQSTYSRPPASAKSLPQAEVSTPANAATRLAATSVPQARMSKLQEMKERTAAAAAARQLEKAAASSSVEQASTNGGFLRNLGGFLGRSADTGNARDREAQEVAERELSRVLQELHEQDQKAEEARVAQEIEAAMAVGMEDAFEVEDFGDRAIVIDDESADEYEVNDSVTLPSLPGDNSYLDDDDDDEPMQETALSALAAAGIQIPTTTPARTPPRPQQSRIARAINSPTPAARPRGMTPTIVVSPPPKPNASKPTRTNSRAPSRATTLAQTRGVTPSRELDDEADDEDDEAYAKARKGASSRNALNSSVSSSVSTLTQAERIAGKVLGVKATPNRVKSVQAAEVAAKKDREERERRAKMREQLERKKAEDKKRREEEDRVKEEEERAKRRADEEERRRKLAHSDKIRRLKMEKAEQQKKQREAEEQKAAEKAAEEEAAALVKRRAAAAANRLSRSQSTSNLTKATASSLSKAAGTKTPATMKRLVPTPSKVTQPLNPSKTTNAKAGPSVFRVEQEESCSTSSIKAVNRPTLGPPSRTSGMGHSAAGPSNPAPVRTHAATALQQQRATLQAQLDQKALDAESENIVLPDINSEYSDSDDSDRETDFKRPKWADSPELKEALEMQASVNPDELFGPIRPLNMEELFNARVGKFRARTSSANWSGADRLTEAEEREYARRMGFKAINPPRDGGQ
ncbi:hypothetical protein CcaverHIS002_0310500 [Cutaneotrichosporon cavernicola]|nr:hypothetical protein CcaverHIS002_0310500 [Cutaneotrichosporon cavernicola]